ncbi:uncharacterized protein LOC62_02G003132 [Vanrija pseudolonga]|uniref:Extracellular membrane protein CFEM domain-containing protein n=1 Tax=Vanrija pseudolonga TaxID=143232 RepID=A0AAF1BJ91_9TREE|nr:hypothetical protein LOC62_02G003132 [Vanrija pseudolonga]
MLALLLAAALPLASAAHYTADHIYALAVRNFDLVDRAVSYPTECQTPCISWDNVFANCQANAQQCNQICNPDNWNGMLNCYNCLGRVNGYTPTQVANLTSSIGVLSSSCQALGTPITGPTTLSAAAAPKYTSPAPDSGASPSAGTGAGGAGGSTASPTVAGGAGAGSSGGAGVGVGAGGVGGGGASAGGTTAPPASTAPAPAASAGGGGVGGLPFSNNAGGASSSHAAGSAAAAPSASVSAVKPSGGVQLGVSALAVLVAVVAFGVCA